MAKKAKDAAAQRGDAVTSLPSASAQKCAVDVVDDLPGTIPLTVAELDVIESYLGPLLDALLDASRCNVIGTSESAGSSGTEPD